MQFLIRHGRRDAGVCQVVDAGDQDAVRAVSIEICIAPPTVAADVHREVQEPVARPGRQDGLVVRLLRPVVVDPEAAVERRARVVNVALGETLIGREPKVVGTSTYDTGKPRRECVVRRGLSDDAIARVGRRVLEYLPVRMERPRRFA